VSCEFTLGIFDAHVACEPPTPFPRPEGDVPEASVNSLETDLFAGTGDRDVDPAPMPADAALSADIPDLNAVRIRQGRQSRRPRAWGGVIEGRRRLHRKRFVRPLMIELLTAASAALRWRAAVGRRRSCGVGFEGPGQAFMTAMVLGVARLDEFWEEPESAPPGRERRQSGQGMGRERARMLGAETAGQADVLKHAGADRCGLGHSGGGEGLAGQQDTPVALGHGKGVAGAAVAGGEVACEVRGPERMGRAHAGGRLPRMTEESAAAFPGHQAVSAQALADGGSVRARAMADGVGCGGPAVAWPPRWGAGAGLR
jgi:hypothetical protein